MVTSCSGHGGKSRSDCTGCEDFLFHDLFDYMGVCCREGKIVTLASPPCECFSERAQGTLKKALQEKGSVYCTYCRRPIFSLVELELHRSHVVASEVFSDEVAREDAPCAD